MKKEIIVQKAIAVIVILALIFTIAICAMKIDRLAELYGCDWRTIMWCTTIPLSIWAGYLWVKLLFSK